MLFEYFQNRIFGEEGYFQKFLGCTLPLHNLKASILNPGIIFLCVSWHAYNTALIRRRRFFMWWRGHLLELHICDFLAVGNEYTCDGNHPHVPRMHAGKVSGKASALGRRELVAGLHRDGYVRYGIVGYNEWWFCWLKYFLLHISCREFINLLSRP